MKKIVEKSLEAALIKASTELNCSVADLEYEIVQNPSDGFFGLGKKEAIIIVETKNHTPHSNYKQDILNQTTHEKAQLDSFTAPQEAYKNQRNKHSHSTSNSSSSKDTYTSPSQAHSSQSFESHAPSSNIWGNEYAKENDRNHYEEKYSPEQNQANIAQIQKEIRELFAFLPFEIDRFEVCMQEDNTLFIYLDGRDCALLIGERGYRYKALSYLLFNWINPRYGYTLRLEIAEFLKNQEEMIDVYLRDIVRLIKLNGKAQTKPLDGILVYIALNKLREIFPDKYVSVRQNEDDEKYIIINDFRR